MTEPSYDAIIIGAGMSGLYQLHRLRELDRMQEMRDRGATHRWIFVGHRTKSIALARQRPNKAALVAEYTFLFSLLMTAIIEEM